METKFVEAYGNGMNWGKFVVSRFDAVERAYRSAAYPEAGQLVGSQGWHWSQHVWVLDLATGEGAYFSLGGLARADLNKHRIHVCVFFEPFLAWLYEHYNSVPQTWWEDLPATVELPGVPPELFGYRRASSVGGG